METCLKGDLSDISTVQNLIKKIGVLELALKSDLGVFGVEDAGLETKIVNSYYEIWRMYDGEAPDKSTGLSHDR